MANPWEFLEAWAKDNVRATAFGDEATARQLAKNCLDAARKAGMPEAAVVKAAGGDLFIFFLTELESAANAEVTRQAENDKH